MNIELIKPRIPEQSGKLKLNGIVRLDGWLSFSFRLYESEKGMWSKLGDSYKDREGHWKDVVFYKKNTEYYKMVHNEIVDAYKRECDNMKHKPENNIPSEPIVPNTGKVFTADDIPF